MALFGKWVELASEDEFKQIDRKEVFHDGRLDLLIVKTEEGYFTVENTCSHEYAPLSGGLLEGCEIECPLHGARFDVRTGKPLTPPANRSIRRFDTKVEDGKVWVKV